MKSLKPIRKLRRLLFSEPQVTIYYSLLVLALLTLFVGIGLKQNWILFSAFFLVAVGFLIDLAFGIWLGFFRGHLKPVYGAEKVQRQLQPKEFWGIAASRVVLAVFWIGIGVMRCVIVGQPLG